MNDSDLDELKQIHRLATAQLQGELTDDQLAELTALLESSDEVRRLYLEYMGDTAALRWIAGGRRRPDAFAPAEVIEKSAVRGASRLTPWLALAVAAGVAAVLAMATNGWNERQGARQDAPAVASSAAAKVATVTLKSAVVWEGTEAQAPLLSRVAVGERLKFASGTIELTFDSGAQVKVFGPASFEISSPMSILCSRGRVTTLVGESGKGFTIDTPKARIVDLGTEFGVNISEAGDTEVVVFQGSVDLTRNSAPGASRRLQQGDALRVDDAGEARRVVAVDRTDFFPSLEASKGRADAPLIEGVRDHIGDGESAKCYQIVRGGLREDALCFVDRSHQWNSVDPSGLPSFLEGADYIMPFNDDKFISDLKVEVRIARPATFFVFLDDNMPPPQWLREGFKDTGMKIGLDGAKTEWHKNNELGVGAGASVDFVFSIWQRDVPRRGTIVLGGVTPPDVKRSKGFNMYGIAVVPK
jgi:hypothetical protein